MDIWICNCIATIIINIGSSRHRNLCGCRCHAQHAKEMNSFNKFSRNFFFFFIRVFWSNALFRRNTHQCIRMNRMRFFFNVLVLHHIIYFFFLSSGTLAPTLISISDGYFSVFLFFRFCFCEKNKKTKTVDKNGRTSVT